jgi:hypothetical protein
MGHDGLTSGFGTTYPDDNLTVTLLTNTGQEIANSSVRKVAAQYLGRNTGNYLGY